MSEMCDCNNTETEYFEERDHYLVVVVCIDCGRIVRQWTEEKD